MLQYVLKYFGPRWPGETFCVHRTSDRNDLLRLFLSLEFPRATVLKYEAN